MGGLFHDLTKSAIQNPGSPTQYVSPGMPTAQAIASDSAATASPSTSDVTGSVGAPGQPDNTSVSMSAPVAAPQPKLVPESFGDAFVNHPEALTTKGQMLRLAINGLLGAGAGASAASEGSTRTGYPSALVGLGAGIQAPLSLTAGIRAQQQASRMAAVEEELKQAQTANATAQATRRETFMVPNTGLVSVGPDGSAKVLIPSNENKAEPDQNSSLPLMLAHATAAAIKAGNDPSQDPTVQAIQTVIDGGKATPKPTGVENDNRYLDILSRQAQGQPISAADAAFAKSYAKMKTLGATAGATIRVEGMNQSRQYPVIDTQNNNQLVMVNASDLNANPGRYAPAGQGAQALSKTALIEDIRGNVQAVRQSLQNMPEFSPTMRAQIAVALKSRDPRSAISSLVGSEAAKTMTPQQQDYLINTALLTENAMAMRSVLGAGQGSEDLRSAITATIPGPTTPTKGYASKQLDAFEQVLDRLERGVPNVPLANGNGGKRSFGQLSLGATGKANNGGGFFDDVPGAVVRKGQ